MRLSEFKLSPGDFANFGHDLQRPQCVWVDDDGIWTSDLRGGIARVRADAEPVILGSGITEPNGFSRRPDGSFVVAGIGDGILYHVAPDGGTRKILDSIDGRPLGTINYACADGNDRVWVSVMTRQPQWQAALTRLEKDGYILRVEENGKRCEIVADNLDLTNEVKVSPDGRYLYAAETLGCRIVRFRIRADGSLGNKETVGPESLGRGALPDGFTFDLWGNIWVTIINQNALFVLDRRGDVAHCLLRQERRRGRSSGHRCRATKRHRRPSSGQLGRNRTIAAADQHRIWRTGWTNRLCGIPRPEHATDISHA